MERWMLGRTELEISPLALDGNVVLAVLGAALNGIVGATGRRTVFWASKR